MASFQNGGQNTEKKCRRNILGWKAPRDLNKCDLESPLNLEHNTFRKENICLFDLVFKFLPIDGVTCRQYFSFRLKLLKNKFSQLSNEPKSVQNDLVVPKL